MTLPSLFDWLIKYAGGVVTIITAIALLSPLAKTTTSRLAAGSTNQRLESMEQAMSQQNEIIGIVLHTLYFEACRRAINRGYTSIDELEDIKYLHKSYKSLNFNGLADALYEKVLDLKTKEELFKTS